VDDGTERDLLEKCSAPEEADLGKRFEHAGEAIEMEKPRGSPGAFLPFGPLRIRLGGAQPVRKFGLQRSYAIIFFFDCWMFAEVFVIAEGPGKFVIDMGRNWETG